MRRPCVRVDREAGERVREWLASAGLLDDGYDIVADDGTIYIPVVSVDKLPAGLKIARHELPKRREQRAPADVLGWRPTYERLGDVVILGEDDAPRARDAARAVMESDVPAETVVNRASKVEGTYRVREFDVLAGDTTETLHREHGYEYRLDIASVYFSPRLATERHRVTKRVEPGEFVVDMFAGVGPFAVPIADRGAEVVAVDRNPEAVRYLRENADRNGVSNRITAVEGDVRGVASEYADRADRLVMNLPHSADEFLDTAVALAGDDCLVHYYDIQHESNPFGPAETAFEAAIEGTDYGFETEGTRVVRSYAPHEENVRVDVRLTVA